MRRILPLLLVGLAWSNALSQEVSTQPLDCSFGPLTKSFGAVPWLVYACSDDQSVVLMSAPDSPAAPFYFMFFRKDGKYVVVGEGTGPKVVTDRAYAELTRLTEPQIQSLLAAAKQAGKRQAVK